MTRFIILPTLLLTAIAAGCGDQRLKPTEAEVEQMFIFHGTAADQPYHDATVSIHDSSSWGVTDPFCTGTLIFDKWIMTAAHCVYGESANGMVVHFGPNGRQINSNNLYNVSRVYWHSGYNPNTVSNDVALLELSEAPTYAQPIMPLPASLGITSADRGGIIDLTGFGFQEDNSYAELMHVAVPIAQVRTTEIEYDQGNGWQGTGGACNGDSGGPAYFERDGAVYLAGTTSYGDYNCTDYGVSMKVDAFESFIESVTGHSVEPYGGTGGTPPGTTPGTETTPPAGGMITEIHQGSVTQGYMQVWKYTTLSAGSHEFVLDGPAGVDLDLYLASKGSGPWTIRAEATTPYEDEVLVVDVPKAGTYAIGVAAFAGNATYTLTVTRPE